MMDSTKCTDLCPGGNCFDACFYFCPIARGEAEPRLQSAGPLP